MVICVNFQTKTVVLEIPGSLVARLAGCLCNNRPKAWVLTVRAIGMVWTPEKCPNFPYQFNVKQNPCAAGTQGLQNWRKERDSNPRYGDSVCRLSRAVHSTTLPSFHRCSAGLPVVVIDLFGEGCFRAEVAKYTQLRPNCHARAKVLCQKRRKRRARLAPRRRHDQPESP